MNPATFNNLSLIAKSSFLWAEGQYIFSRNQNGAVVKLYAIYNFFVEVSFNPANRQVEMISVLDTYRRLDPYIALIKLPAGFAD